MPPIDIAGGLVVALPSFAIGVGVAVVAARKGQVSEATCKVCKTSLSTSIKEISTNITKVFERLDETNKSLGELCGYIKGSRGQEL